MTRLFDGFTELFTGTFGDPVLVRPSGGAQTEIQAVFRDADIPVLAENGVETIAPYPTLRAHRDDAAPLIPDGEVDPGNGEKYRCLAPMDSGSPDPRGFVTIQLERI
ncbi:hypothetical protein [Ruegeria sp. Ofav3-42]|uniref:head-tail joining protein n=1 Tax=Ruegeria sp. Ofav3-42 TaxID=2917759 RepID=UPI001EF6E9C6|nr:hypothetical protein [Ruegeria sp. Ofav3-42]MCG7520851.1 hypothetical protein [Ruegeria sp. Ofav3-42]